MRTFTNSSSFFKARLGFSQPYLAKVGFRRLLVLLFFVGSFITVQAQCTLTLKPTVSGCYSTTAGSRSTVSVEVGWQNAPPDQYIIVTGPIGSTPTSRTITPGPYTTTGGNGNIVSPQVVAFEIVANAASGLTASARFSTTTSCSAISSSFSAPAACEPTPCSSGQLGGTVFNDFNADGIKDSGETSGLIGVTVKVYDCLGNLVGTVTTDVFGKYTFTGLNAGSYPLRVEFSNLPAIYAQGTQNGTDGRTTVQFVDAPNCTVDLGVLNPTDYCESNPKMALPCYVYGDPLPLGSTSGERDAMVSFDYALAGITNMGAMTHIATAAQVGTIWGEAYNKNTQKLFMAATLKRHSGLGTLGLGGIYVSDWTDPNNPVTTPWLSVTSLIAGGVNINVGTIGVNGAGGRGLSTDPTQSSRDPEAFTKAGKAGIGGITLSDDGNTLFFTNMFDAKLYKVNMTTYNANGTNPTSATAINVLSSTGCTGGTMRPWATKYYKGNVYVGAVCDAQTSQSKGDLRAFVYEVNPTTGTSTIVFDFPLTYPKGFPNANALDATGWYPWSDLWSDKYITAANEAIYPQPILSDLEFDIDGTMILGFGDRNGIQTGYLNYEPTGNSTAQYSGNVGGDILRAYSNGGGTFVLENNAKAGPNIGYGPNNNQGPGFGEYYNDNFYDAGSDKVFHAELAQGGLAVRPGSGEVIAVTVDPVDIPLTAPDYRFYTQAGGVRHYNNTTGQTNSGYVVYTSNFDSGTFGKATGLGDVVLRCSTPSFLEIGNRVWLDTDNDGIQDPCEPSLSGVNVALYQGSTLIATTTTNASGEYYFNNNPISSTVTGTVSTTSLLPNTPYSIVFGSGGQFASNILSVGTAHYQMTQAFSSAPTASTLNDSNIALATVAGNSLPTASVTTGSLGSVDHTIDAGFICVPVSGVISSTAATCNGSDTNANGRISVTNIQNADKVFLIMAGSPIPSYTAVGGQPVSASATSFTGLSNPASTTGQTYQAVLYNGPACYTIINTVLAQTNCCNLTVTVGTPVCNGNTYTVSGIVSLTVTPAQAQTLTVRDNGVVQATINLTSGQTTANLSLTGLSNGSSHTVTVSSSNSVCAATANYTAPVAVSATLTSSTVCAGQPVTLTATGGTSYTFSTGTTNTTGLLTFTPTSTTTISVTVGNASGCRSTTLATVTVNQAPSLTITSTTICAGQTGTLTASGANTYLWSTGATTPFISVTASGTYSVTGTSAQSCSAIGSGQVTVTEILTPTIIPGLCQSATNTYSSTVVVTVNNPIGGQILTISDGSSSQPFTTTAASVNTFTAVFNGLPSDGGNHTVTVSLPNCGSATTIYSAPGSCTQPAGTLLSLNKLVDKSKAKVGDVLTYTLVLSNIGTTTATNVVVRDSATVGLTYVASSASAPGGTTFTQGTPISVWTVASISAGQSLSLTFQAIADSSGILYNVATIPGDTAKVCTSIPVTMCPGDEFTLTVPAGRAGYRWYKDGVLIQNQITNVLVVTEPGSYSLGVDNAGGVCPDFSCCPFIVELDSLPVYQAVAVPSTCQGNSPQNNGQLVLSKFKPTDTYQYSLGASFNPAASLSGAPKLIPANGVIATTLANPGTAQVYTVRVYNSSGCFTDVTVMLIPTVCGCPAEICVPFVLTQTKRPIRIGDPR